MYRVIVVEPSLANSITHTLLALPPAVPGTAALVVEEALIVFAPLAPQPKLVLFEPELVTKPPIPIITFLLGPTTTSTDIPADSGVVEVVAVTEPASVSIGKVVKSTLSALHKPLVLQ